MRKKLFTLFLAVAASVGTILAWDYERVQIGDLYYNLDASNQTAEVTSGGNYSGSVVIPANVAYETTTTYSVTSVGDDTFYGCSGLTSVTIPNSVTSIGDYAFYGCTGLTSVTIPNSVTSIGDWAFRGCTGLTSVTIPNSVTSIGEYAFQGCSSLTSVTIGNSVTSIGESAFYECTGLTSVIIPNSVTSIGDWAFAYCSGLTSITIPNSVTSIGQLAFYSCSSLTSVTIPNSVTSIGDWAFRGCTGLTSVTIPNSVTSIGDLAFAYCIRLTSITCEANNPPTCGSNAFEEVPKSIPLYVPFGSEDAYQNATGWSYFTNIQPIKADNVDITTVEVVPDETSVNIAWPKVSGAYTYELVIKDKSGQVVCTLVFDAEGRLLSIAFNAPARDNMPQQTQVAGFAFTVTGLNSGTTYNYSIASKDSNGNTLNTESGSFKTTGESTGLQNVTHQPDETKFFRNGQLFIQRDGKTYSVTGQEVK